MLLDETEEARPALPPLVDVCQLGLLGLGQLSQEAGELVDDVAAHPEQRDDDRHDVQDERAAVELAHEQRPAAHHHQEGYDEPVPAVEQEVVVELGGAENGADGVELGLDLDGGHDDRHDHGSTEPPPLDGGNGVPLSSGQPPGDRQQQSRRDAQDEVAGDEPHELLARVQGHEPQLADESHHDHADRGEEPAEEEREHEVVADEPVEAQQVELVVHVSPVSDKGRLLARDWNYRRAF